MKTPKTPPRPSPLNNKTKLVIFEFLESYGPVILLGFALLLSLFTRLRLLGIPLERDEGEYAYAGQMILRGIPPYLKVYNMKLPGIYAAYASLLAIFGEGIAPIRLGLLLANVLSTALLFGIAKKIHGRTYACFTASFFTLFSMGPCINGFWANSENFVLPFILLGLFIMLLYKEKEKLTWLFLSGASFGTAFIIKQHAAAFCLFSLVALFLIQKESGKPEKPLFRWGILFTGLLLPFTFTCLLFSGLHLFDKFWFWTMTYARAYATSVDLVPGLKAFSMQFLKAISGYEILWGLSLAGIVLLISGLKKSRPFSSLLMLSFIFFSFLAICPGLYFRTHYFIFMLPPLSLVCALPFLKLSDSPLDSFFKGKSVSFFAALLTLLIPLLSNFSFFFLMTPAQASREVFSLNPFPESVEISKYIKSHTTPKDEIAVLGSEPQIYFYSDRVSATGYIYTYALFEEHGFALKMQEEFIHDIETRKPKMIVLVNILSSWLIRENSQKKFLEWMKPFLDSHYEKIGLVNLFYDKPSSYFWDESALDLSPTSVFWVGVYKRKEGVQ